MVACASSMPATGPVLLPPAASPGREWTHRRLDGCEQSRGAETSGFRVGDISVPLITQNNRFSSCDPMLGARVRPAALHRNSRRQGRGFSYTSPLGSNMVRTAPQHVPTTSWCSTALGRSAMPEIQYFDTTPPGRIANRFSRGVDCIDNQLQMTFLFLLRVLYSIFSSLAVAIDSQPYVILALLPTVVFYYELMVLYNVTNREIRRVGSIVKAPMISLLGKALVGSSTIKAYGCVASIMKESLRRIDRVCASSFLENATNRWLGVRVEFLGNVIVITIALLGVIGTMISFSTHDIGLVSLSLTNGVGVHVTAQLACADDWHDRGRHEQRGAHPALHPQH
ncbi:ABC transporter transmembrane region [Trypanosoma cruzi]|uniref:ABC transporter transmembrane region n=1 Tax=Trypanosoma cruzi TaxID=5693 RepID=A0A7J6XSX7_TRYCR|nr:ABC transporter transmembrane region [Trypanosoma cruzi]